MMVCDTLAPLSALQHAEPEAEIIKVAKISARASTLPERIDGVASSSSRQQAGQCIQLKVVTRSSSPRR